MDNIIFIHGLYNRKYSSVIVSVVVFSHLDLLLTVILSVVGALLVLVVAVLVVVCVVIR